jgi:hypothetical protein
MEHNISHDTNDSILLNPDGTVPPLPAKKLETWLKVFDPELKTWSIASESVLGPDGTIWYADRIAMRIPSEEIADAIVTDHNTHDALVDALEYIENNIMPDDEGNREITPRHMKRIRTALAAARKEGAG